jgi:hypothetical protein
MLGRCASQNFKLATEAQRHRDDEEGRKQKAVKKDEKDAERVLLSSFILPPSSLLFSVPLWLILDGESEAEGR